MLGIKYIKFDTTTYVVHYTNGKVKKEGKGLSFFYYAPSSSIAAIPMGSDDVQFIFNESTADFQVISIQGQITFKIDEPKQLAELLDFTVDEKGNYKKDHVDKLHQRLSNESQTATSSYIQGLNLKTAIRSAKKIEEYIIEGLKQSKAVQMLGITPLSVNIISVKPDPAMSKALEAETRESLQKDADQAIYERRNFGVEQERMIRESELSTEIAVEEKKKQIAEKKMEAKVQEEESNRKLREMRIDADVSVQKKQMEATVLKEENERKLREIKIETDIAIETERQKLVDLKVENDKKEAQAQAFALDLMMAVYKDVDWKVLTAVSGKQSDSRMQIALAFREMAENAQKIGNLHITPDLLTNLIQQQETNGE